MPVIYDLFFIDSSDRCHLRDLFIHQWLCETWLIELVVTHLTVADEINDHVLLELLSESSCCLEDKVDIFDGVRVDMEDGSID